MTRVRDAYLAYNDTMLDWFETLAKDDFGRDIPQILLIHSNDLHTDVLDALLTKFEQRGYRWVTLAEAMKDAGLPDAGRVRRHLRSVLAASLAGGEEAAVAHERRAGPAAVDSSMLRKQLPAASCQLPAAAMIRRHVALAGRYFVSAVAWRWPRSRRRSIS